MSRHLSPVRKALQGGRLSPGSGSLTQTGDLIDDAYRTKYVPNYAGQFTAANLEYLSIADNASLSSPETSFGVFVWVRADAVATTMAVVAKYVFATDNREYILRHNHTTNRFEWQVSSDGTSGALTTVVAETLGNVATDTWYFVSGWYSSDDDTVNVAVNLGGTDSESHSGGGFDGTAAFEVGAQSGGTGRWDGRIGPVLFAKRVLTAAERTWLYNGGTARRSGELGIAGTDGANLNSDNSVISYWDMNEVSGTRYDAIGTNDLTDNNTVTRAEGAGFLADEGDGEQSRLTYDDIVLAKSPAGYWPLSESSGNALDLSGNGNDGTVTIGAGVRGARSLLNDGMGSSIDFDGSATFITSPIADTSTTNWTLEAWVQLDSLSQLGIIACVGDDSGGFAIGVGNGAGSTGDKLSILCPGVGWGDPDYTFESTSTRYYIALTRSTGNLIAYVNGELTGAEVALTPSTPDSVVTIGGEDDGAGAPRLFFNGHIQKVAHHATAFTAAQVAENYEAGLRQLSETWQGSTRRTGVYGAYTNLVTNGGGETDATSWTVRGGGTVARATSDSKFGSASIEVGTSASGDGTIWDNGLLPATQSQVYAVSGWLKAKAAGDVGKTVTVIVESTGGTYEQLVNTGHVLTADWAEFTGSGTWANAAHTKATIALFDASGQSGYDFYADGLQYVASSIPLPYVETDGATAAAVAGRIQIPSTGMSATAGAVVGRWKLGYNSTDTLPTAFIFMDWFKDGNDFMNFDVGVDQLGQWRFFRRSGGVDATKSITKTFSEGDDLAIAFSWDANSHQAAFGGGAFSSGASIPSVGLTGNIDIGSGDAGLGANRNAHSDCHWQAFYGPGGQLLGDADSAYINSLGNDASWEDMPLKEHLVGFWDGHSFTYTSFV